MQLKKLVETKTARTAANDIRSRIDKYRLSETGLLRKSVRVKVGGTAESPTIEVFSVYYGRFVRASLLKKNGVDLFAIDTEALGVEIADYVAKQAAAELVGAFSKK